MRLSRETGDTYGLEMLLINLGSAALLARELDQARPLFAEALRVSNEIDDRVAQYILLDLLGCHAAEFNAGKRLSRDAAIGTALGEPAHVVAATPDDASVAPIGFRPGLGDASAIP